MCPVCSGTAIHLGNLGPVAWYRCRQCGAEFSAVEFDLEDDEQEEE